MDSYSDFNTQHDAGFTEMPFSEVPFKDVPFDENVPIEATPAPMEVTTVPQAVVTVAPVQEPPDGQPVTPVVQGTVSTAISSPTQTEWCTM